MPKRIKVVDIELSRPLKTVAGLDGYTFLQGLVRLHGVPIGYVQVPVTCGRCSANALSQAILERHSQNIIRQLLLHGILASPLPDRFAVEKLFHLPSPTASHPLPLLTVVVCHQSEGEPAMAKLSRCLSALDRLDYPHLDILIVDSAPNPGTEQLVRTYPMRYVAAPSGLAEVRNRGIVEARGEIVAYIDKDVAVDSEWAKALSLAFSEPEVMAVTGLVVPDEMVEVEADRILERQVNVFGQGFGPQRYRFEQNRKLYRQIVNTRPVGTGINMAFRRSVFAEVGSFNPDLNTEDTHSGGALEMFFRILNAGHTLLYEPRVLVRHQHCWDRAWLRSQTYAESLGLFSYFISAAQTNPDKRLAFSRVGFWYLRGMLRSWLRPYGFPRELIQAELQGFFTGLGRYRKLSGKKIAKPIAATNGNAPTPTGERFAVRMTNLNQPLQGLTDVADYPAVRVFVTWNCTLLGSVDIANQYQSVSALRLREAIAAQLWQELLPNRTQTPEVRLEQAQADLTEILTPEEEVATRLPAEIPVSIVVATYDRPDDLKNCLRHLLAQQTPRPVEIIVTDNHPASGISAAVVAEFPEVKLVSEERKGAAYARNAGFTASCGEIIVSVDDDVTVPPDWLEKLLVPFVREDVMLVTGNVLPVELETSAQYLFEKTHNGLSQGLKPFEVNGEWLKSFYYSPPVWELGVSANAAYRAEIFTHPEIGLMDEIVSTGTPAGGGEDPYLFYKVLKAGLTLVYEPSAYVWHKHRRDLSALQRQMFNYSKSCIAYHLVIWLRDRDPRGLEELLIYLPGYYLRKSYRRLRRKHDCPWSLISMEVAGYFAGPLGLWRSYRSFQRTGPSAPYIPVSERREAEAPRLQTTVGINHDN